jgi:hypothetical protein
MLPAVQYKSPVLKQSLAEWSRSVAGGTQDSLAAWEEHLAEWFGSHYDAMALVIEDLRPEGDMMILSLHSDGWAGCKEVALLPDGSLAG